MGGTPHFSIFGELNPGLPMPSQHSNSGKKLFTISLQITCFWCLLICISRNPESLTTVQQFYYFEDIKTLQFYLDHAQSRNMFKWQFYDVEELWKNSVKNLQNEQKLRETKYESALEEWQWNSDYFWAEETT